MAKSHIPKINPSQIIIAWVERCAGPGWSNAPMWVLYRTDDGALAIDAIQPDRFNRDAFILSTISDDVSMRMKSIAQCIVSKDNPND